MTQTFKPAYLAVEQVVHKIGTQCPQIPKVPLVELDGVFFADWESTMNTPFEYCPCAMAVIAEPAVPSTEDAVAAFDKVCAEYGIDIQAGHVLYAIGFAAGKHSAS